MTLYLYTITVIVDTFVICIIVNKAKQKYLWNYEYICKNFIIEKGKSQMKWIKDKRNHWNKSEIQ